MAKKVKIRVFGLFRPKSGLFKEKKRTNLKTCFQKGPLSDQGLIKRTHSWRIKRCTSSSPPIWFSSHCRMENLSQSRTSQQVFRRKRWPKKEYSGNILHKFTNISSFKGGKKCYLLVSSIFKTQQPCIIGAINWYTWIALKMGQKMRIYPDFTALVGSGCPP